MVQRLHANPLLSVLESLTALLSYLDLKQKWLYSEVVNYTRQSWGCHSLPVLLTQNLLPAHVVSVLSVMVLKQCCPLSLWMSLCLLTRSK